jgi:hypothetical protein
MRRAAAAALLGMVMAGCSSSSVSNTTGPRPSSSSHTSPTSSPSSGLIVAVRLTPDTGGGWISGGTSWDIDLRRPDGSLAATAHAQHAGGMDLFDALPLSTTSAAAYFLDGPTTIRRLAPDGSSGVATTTPAPDGGDQRVLFAVSSDDTRIAFAVFSRAGENATHETITVRRLDGGGARTLADQVVHVTDRLGSVDRPFDVPIGWHGDDLVVGESTGVQNSPNGLLVRQRAIAWYDTVRGGRTSGPCGSDTDDLDGVLALAAGVSCRGVLHRWNGSTANLAPGGAWVSPDGTMVAGTQDGHVAAGRLDGPAMTATSTEPGLIAGWLDSSHLVVQDVNAPSGGRSRVLTVSGTTIASGDGFPGYAMDTIPARLR